MTLFDNGSPVDALQPLKANPLRSQENGPLTVAHLSALLKHHVEEAFCQVRVRGEVSAPKHHTSGHLYLALKDEKAVLDAVCWRPQAMRYRPLLAEGQEVVCHGRLTTYPARSKYQLVIQHVEPVGEGALLKLLEERKAKLKALGLFDASRKRALPRFPKTIGVITSPTGAVIRDILHRLQDRFPCQVYVWPVAVQGEGAAAQIVNAVQRLPLVEKPFGRPDVIVVARGGGSIEDLWAFNDEGLAQAVAGCPVPVISAVGHETDTTLIDYVADMRAPTPTAAAEHITPHRETLLTQLKTGQQRLQSSWERLLNNQQRTLALVIQLFSRTDEFIYPYAQRLDELEGRLQKFSTHLDSLGQHVQLLARQLKEPAVLLAGASERVFQLVHRLALIQKAHLAEQTQRLSFVTKRLANCSYRSILKRGFCLARTAEGLALSTQHQAKAEKALSLEFQDGALVVSPNPQETD